MRIFALAFSSEVASEMKHALLVWFAALLPLPTNPRGLRELYKRTPPLYPRTHEVLGWIQGTRYAIKKRENRCPRNSRYSRDIENKTRGRNRESKTN